jgi:hypothetical protein
MVGENNNLLTRINFRPQLNRICLVTTLGPIKT